MKSIQWLAIIILLAFNKNCFAYLPPCSYIVKKIASGRAQKKVAIVYLSVYKPAENNKSTDQLLGEKVLILSADTTNSSDTWPALSLLLESNPEKLWLALHNFGLPLPREKDLLVMPAAKYTTQKDSPQPFYTQDKEISLHRYRNGYAWSCENEDKSRSLWIEKDSFIPRELRGPCPDALSGSSCVVEMQNTWDLHDTKNARLLVKRSDKNLYLLKIEHVIFNPDAAALQRAKESIQKAAAEKSLSEIDALLH